MLQFKEHYESGDGSIGRSGGDIYRITVWGDPVLDNADDPATIMNAAIPQFSQVSSTGNIVTNFRREKIAPGMWIVEASYTDPYDIRESTSSQFSFTTGGGSTHITHSRQTMGVYALADSVDTHGGAINVDQDGTINGLDIGPGTSQGTFEFKTTHYLPTLQPALVNFLQSHPCAVNSDQITINFDGVLVSGQPGEIQLQYAEGSKRRGFGDFELTLHWSKSPNRTNFQVGEITVDTKNGWDYMWVECAPNAGQTRIVSQPIVVWVERVYEYQTLNLVLAMIQSPGEPAWVNPSTGGISVPTLNLPNPIF